MLERWRGSEHFGALNRLAIYALQIPEGGEEIEFRGAIARLVEQRRETELDQLLSKARDAQISETEKRRLNQLLAARSPRDENNH